MGILERAQDIRDVMNSAAASLDDKTASKAPRFFDGMKFKGATIKAGTRIHWNGEVVKAKEDIEDLAQNSPDSSPDRWEGIGYKDGYRIATNNTTFREGELGWWEGELYESTEENNKHNPGTYPSGWRKVRR